MIINIAPEKSLENINQRLRARFVHTLIPGTSIGDVVLVLNGIVEGELLSVMLTDEDGCDAFVSVMNCIVHVLTLNPMKAMTKSLVIIEFLIVIGFTNAVLLINNEK